MVTISRDAECTPAPPATSYQRSPHTVEPGRLWSGGREEDVKGNRHFAQHFDCVLESSAQGEESTQTHPNIYTRLLYRTRYEKLPYSSPC